MLLLPLHADALVDLVEAVAELEREREGFGDKLFAEVRKMVALASTFPRSGRAVEGLAERFDVRQFAVPRFRYVVVTALVRGERRVIAVAHTRRDPKYWHERVR